MPRLMKFMAAFAVASVALVSQLVVATNQYPVVLVHGFGGWGRDEMLGFKYWGGNNNDYQGRLQTAGFNVMTATIGPFASNWDRACELYAQIKGGRVDYGPNHATKHGHARYGRTYTALFPQWGTVVNGKLQKIHLVGHSMGGQTIRTLVQLLNQGTKGAPVTEAAASHPLFAGGKDWVHSVTTISTPNQGTTLADGFSSMVDKVEKALIGFFGASSLLPGAKYDSKLDQWGITARGSSESISSYVHRVFSSPFFGGAVTDSSRYELSTVGAKALNAWVRTQPSVYYYSISTQDTFSFVNFQFKKVQLPNPVTMLIPLQPCATYIGSTATTDRGFPASWMANDGQVNVPSQLSDGTGRTVNFAGGSSVRGAWNVYETKNHVDHYAIAGNSIYYDTLDTFSAQIRVLLNLPSKEELGSRRLMEGELDVHQHPQEIEQEVQRAHRELFEKARAAAIQQCGKKKNLTAEEASTCERLLKIAQPDADAGPVRNLRGN